MDKKYPIDLFFLKKKNKTLSLKLKICCFYGEFTTKQSQGAPHLSVDSQEETSKAGNQQKKKRKMA